MFSLHFDRDTKRNIFKTHQNRFCYTYCPSPLFGREPQLAPPTRTSDKGTLARWLAEVRTQAQMVELTEQEFGHRVSRSAIANALIRFGLAGSTPRYHDYIPWRINPVHATAHPLRILRLLGRRGENNFLNQREMDMLDSWLKQMKDKGFIVGYDPNDPRGFHYINKKYKDHKDTIQIRRAVLHI